MNNFTSMHDYCIKNYRPLKYILSIFFKQLINERNLLNNH